MFSLIISIISIALVAALAAATVYFGGAAFNKGSAGADASAFVNSGQQIAGAFTLAAADGYTVATVGELQDGSLGQSAPAAADGDVYLAQIPSYKGNPLSTLVTSGSGATIKTFVSTDVSDQVCAEVNKRAVGETGTVPAALVNVGLFGCVEDSAATPATYTSYYKVK